MIPTEDALTAICNILSDSGIESPRREARLILAHALGCNASALFAKPHVPSNTGLDLARRRAQHEPLAHLTGTREFWSLELVVSPATLIPRPDSETLVEAALRHRPDRTSIRSILDLGTGTGALLLAGLTEYPAATGIGTDCVAAAATLARANANRLGFAARAQFLVADWATPLAARFDLILCNPPYIASAEIAGLMPDVARYEPASALDGGADGLAAYRIIIADLPRLLAPNGIAIVEAGAGQEDAIGALAAQAGLSTVSHADLAGVPRAIVMTNQARSDEKTIW